VLSLNLDSVQASSLRSLPFSPFLARPWRNVIRKLIWFGHSGNGRCYRPTSEKSMGNIVRTDKSILGVGQWNWSVYSLYGPDGTQVPLIVTIPPPEGSKGPSTPTGTVFNGTDDFVVSGNGTSGPAIFIS